MSGASAPCSRVSVAYIGCHRDEARGPRGGGGGERMGSMAYYVLDPILEAEEHDCAECPVDVEDD